jgi:plasmid stabilization system protein ParE
VTDFRSLIATYATIVEQANIDHQALDSSRQLAADILAALPGATGLELAEGFAKLVDGIDLADLASGSYARVDLAGQLILHSARDAHEGTIVKTYTEVLRLQLIAAAEFADELLVSSRGVIRLMDPNSQSQEGQEDDPDDDHEPDFDEIDDEVIYDVMDELGTRMPRQAHALASLDSSWKTTIAMASQFPQIRTGCVDLVPTLYSLSQLEEGAHWIAKILRAPHVEPALVIDVGAGLGYECRLSGIAENFQLHTLLMGLPHTVGHEFRPTVEVLTTASGHGPMHDATTVVGMWNPCTWQAVGPDGHFDATDSVHWIWNEGDPLDIASFDGRRVILLGPPSYQRSWPSSRMFPELQAEVTIDAVLAKAEVDAWMQRFADASATATNMAPSTTTTSAQLPD